MVERKTDFARKLRNDPTDAEKRLWLYLRRDQLGVRFRRQLSIGPYIVDFVCPSKKLIIELDGGQHANQSAEDAKRTEFLEQQGYKVLRYWNNEVFQNIEAVLKSIKAALDK